MTNKFRQSKQQRLVFLERKHHLRWKKHCASSKNTPSNSPLHATAIPSIVVQAHISSSPVLKESLTVHKKNIQSLFRTWSSEQESQTGRYSYIRQKTQIEYNKSKLWTSLSSYKMNLTKSSEVWQSERCECKNKYQFPGMVTDISANKTSKVTVGFVLKPISLLPLCALQFTRAHQKLALKSPY